MDEIRNPYTPGAGAAPDALTGRDEEIQQLRVALARMRIGRPEQSVIVTGLRGVGKTVLLNEFEEMAEAESFLAYYHELTPETDLLEALSRDLAAALIRMDVATRVKSALAKALSHLRSVRVSVGEDVEFTLTGASIEEGVLTADLTDLLVEVGAVARKHDRGILFLLDELQFVGEVEYRALISALHRAANQKRLPILMAGAGLPQIPKLSGEARSYAERLFRFREIGRLDHRAARAALLEPAAALRVGFAKGALDAALAWADGYPFFIQVIGKHAWNTATKSPIGGRDVEIAAKLGRRDLDSGFYRVRLQRATADELAYMRAMASLGAGPYSSGDVIARLGKTHQQTGTTRRRLIDKGLIYPTPEHGQADFTVPGFADYLTRTAER